jgi:pyridoxal phosphate enzyme (YggS family)
MTLYENAWQALRSRISAAAQGAGRDPSSIRLLAVTKGFPTDVVRAAYALGQRAFGENYVQEALEKVEALSAELPDLEWHLIGPLQGNKVRAAAAHFSWVQTIDRPEIAERLSAARDAHLPPLNVCAQVNISGERTKSGAAPEAALTLARNVARLPRLRFRGFMGIADPTVDGARQRAQFRLLRQVFDNARVDGLPLDTLSIGMSDDLEAAVAEGSTLVRIGTGLFGPRPARQKAVKL